MTPDQKTRAQQFMTDMIAEMNVKHREFDQQRANHQANVDKYKIAADEVQAQIDAFNAALDHLDQPGAASAAVAEAPVDHARKPTKS